MVVGSGTCAAHAGVGNTLLGSAKGALLAEMLFAQSLALVLVCAHAHPSTRQLTGRVLPSSAQAEGTTLDALKKLNPDVEDPDLIQPGGCLLILCLCRFWLWGAWWPACAS